MRPTGSRVDCSATVAPSTAASSMVWSVIAETAEGTPLETCSPSECKLANDVGFCRRRPNVVSRQGDRPLKHPLD